MSRLKEPPYQCFRERIGVVKLIEDFEKISAELKSRLMVNGLYSSPPDVNPPPNLW